MKETLFVIKEHAVTSLQCEEHGYVVGNLVEQCVGYNAEGKPTTWVGFIACEHCELKG